MSVAKKKDRRPSAVRLSPETMAAIRELGRQGGKLGGPARAANLSKARRQQIARDAAKTRWKVVKASKKHAADQEAKKPST
jgi:hypothetical protein